MANFEAFSWNFSSSTNLEFVKSDWVKKNFSYTISGGMGTLTRVLGIRSVQCHCEMGLLRQGELGFSSFLP